MTREEEIESYIRLHVTRCGGNCAMPSAHWAIALIDEQAARIAELSLTAEESILLVTLLTNDVQGRGKRIHADLIAKVQRLTNPTA